MRLQAGDLAAPEVAGTGAGGAVAVEGHGAGRERHEGGTGEVLRGAHRRTRVEPDRVAVGPAAVQVEAHQLGDVLGARAARDVGGRALLHDPALLHDDQAVGQHHGVQRVVRDEHGDGLEGGQVAAELGAHLQPGAGVQGGERFVQEQQPGVGGRARARATRRAWPPERRRGWHRRARPGRRGPATQRPGHGPAPCRCTGSRGAPGTVRGTVRRGGAPSACGEERIRLLGTPTTDRARLGGACGAVRHRPAAGGPP
ncbi:hypothetical protein SGRIM128S_06429 [Streptomyces griseomycini]